MAASRVQLDVPVCDSVQAGERPLFGHCQASLKDKQERGGRKEETFRIMARKVSAEGQTRDKKAPSSLQLVTSEERHRKHYTLQKVGETVRNLFFSCEKDSRTILLVTSKYKAKLRNKWLMGSPKQQETRKVVGVICPDKTHILT